MTNARANDLYYGHVGRITYDEETQTWESQRALEHNGSLQRIDGAASQIRGSQLETQDDTSDALTKELAIQHASRSHNDLSAATQYLDTELRSYVAPAEQARPELGTGEVLATGFFEDVNSGDVRRLIACPGGDRGDELHIYLGTYRQRQQSGDETQTPSAIDFSDSACIAWTARRGPICQIDSSSSKLEDRTLFGIRFCNSFCMLKVVHRDAHLSKIRSQDEVLPATSPITVEIIFDSSSSILGLADVVHLALSPYGRPSLAAVTWQGNWSAFEVPQKLSGKTLSCRKGSLYESDAGSSNPGPRSAFHCIQWLDSSSMVAVNTRDISVITLQDERVRYDSDALGLEKEEIIRGLRINPKLAHHVFVLTSSRILWLAERNDDEPHLLETLIAVKTGYEPSDTSWRLLVDPLEDGHGNVTTERQFLMNTVPAIIDDSRRSGTSTNPRSQWLSLGDFQQCRTSPRNADISNVLVYEEVCVKSDVETVHFKDSIPRLGGFLGKPDLGSEPTLILLNAVVGRNVIVDDVEANTELLAQSLANVRPSDLQTWSTGPLLLPKYLTVVLGEGNIATRYRGLVSNWLGSLSEIMPGVIRLAVENICRRISVGLTLSSVVLRPRLELPPSLATVLDDRETPARADISHPAQVEDSEAKIDAAIYLRRLTYLAPDSTAPTSLTNAVLAEWRSSTETVEEDKREAVFISEPQREKQKRRLERDRRRAHKRLKLDPRAIASQPTPTHGNVSSETGVPTSQLGNEMQSQPVNTAAADKQKNTESLRGNAGFGLGGLAFRNKAKRKAGF
ncbi:MAG: hypothetical protein M1828_006425 [Chrysothrix sp. TS-e1954]|nr:MAG: hypothetical protein M1828_006425 [Chrysothrix sp. TS-e1954]